MLKGKEETMLEWLCNLIIAGAHFDTYLSCSRMHWGEIELPDVLKKNTSV